MTLEKDSALYKHYKNSLDSIYVHPDSESSPVAQRMKELFPEKIAPFENLNFKNTKELSPEEFSQSKKDVLIQPHKGQFFKQCPGGNTNSACCNYFVLNLGSQCHFNCSYCYLQSFINSPYLVIYSNIFDAITELKTLAAQMPHQDVRVGTGEVIDSLGLDPLTLYSEEIMKALPEMPNVNLELKTKSSFVDHLLNVDHHNQVTVSWSINPEAIVSKEEHGTASMHERLKAAYKCKQSGYKIGLHIDPVIWHENWERNYTKMAEEITSIFEPEDVPYISLGALRFQPEQRHMMKSRFSRKSIVNQAEVFPSKDGKLRYDTQLRSKMFRTIIKAFKSHSRKWNVFLCMEAPETWLSTYGSYPKKVEGLEELFEPKKKPQKTSQITQ